MRFRPNDRAGTRTIGMRRPIQAGEPRHSIGLHCRRLGQPGGAAWLPAVGKATPGCWPALSHAGPGVVAHAGP
jgi:hypothetical protein